MLKKVLLVGCESFVQSTIENITPKGDGVYNNTFFTGDLTQAPFDAVVRCYIQQYDVCVKVRKNTFFALPIEYHSGKWNDGNHWVIDNNGPYDYLIGALDVFKGMKNLIVDMDMDNWSEKSISYWTDLPVPETQYEDRICWITSNAIEMPGHRKRMEFYNAIYKKMSNLDVYGRGFTPIETKEPYLVKYKYGISIENGYEKYMYSEKVLDIWLSYGLPFYYGGYGLAEFFPPESFIWIDINDPDRAIAIMQQAIKNKEWEKRLPAIKQARQLILHKYNRLARLADIIDTYGTQDAYVDMVIPANNQYTIRHRFYDKIQKLRKSIWKRRVGYYNW